MREQMAARMLKNPVVQAEHDRLNREEFSNPDEILAARRAAGLTQAQAAERMVTKAPRPQAQTPFISNKSKISSAGNY